MTKKTVPHTTTDSGIRVQSDEHSLTVSPDGPIVLHDDQRKRLVANVSGHLADGVSEKVLVRAFQYWRNVDDAIGQKIEDKTREMIGGKSEAPGMASALSIAGQGAAKQKAGK